MNFSNELNMNHLTGVNVTIKGPMQPYSVDYSLDYIENFDTKLRINT